MRISFGSALLLVGAVAGYVTGLQALGEASRVSAAGNSGWTQERINPKDSYAIYAVGHFLSNGLLPPERGMSYYTRNTDEDSNGLRSSCTYQLSGSEPRARWWSVRAAPAGNPGAAVTFSARDAILSGDDGFTLSISHRTQPGNWLAVPDFGAMQVFLVLNESYPLAKDETLKLPVLRRIACE